MLTGDRVKYFGLIFAIAFCTFVLENQTTIFANIMKRTGHQIMDVTDAEVWVMDPRTEYWEQTKALKDTDLTRVRGVAGVQWAVRLFKGNRWPGLRMGSSPSRSLSVWTTPRSRARRAGCSSAHGSDCASPTRSSSTRPVTSCCFLESPWPSSARWK